jgi:hypothetical protein
MPHKCKHPDLGEIWIGGTRKKHMSRTPPARYIKMEAEKNVLFVMYCASQFPKVEIEETVITPATDELYWVEVAVKNDRVYPTASDRALKLKRAVKDKITVSSSKNITIINAPKGQVKTEPTNSRAMIEIVTGKGAEFRLKGKQTLRFCALVKLNGSSGWVEFKVKSQHGGMTRKRVEIKVSN